MQRSARSRAARLRPTRRILLAAPLAAGLACAPAPPQEAAVVEWVAPEGAAGRAGLESGDRVFAFERAPAPPANPEAAQGAVASCLDFALAELEQAPRGAVTLAVWRQGRRRSVAVPPGEWKAAAVPARKAAADRPLCEALARGRRAFANRQWEEAQAAFEEGLAAAEPLGQPLAAALAWGLLGNARLAAEDLGAAEEALSRSLSLRREAAAGTLAEAAAWHALATLHEIRSALDRADEEHHAALELRSRLAPGSLEEGGSIYGLGTVAMLRGRYEEAGRLFEEALAIAEGRAPESLLAAQALTSLGSLAQRKGRVEDAEARLVRAQGILKQVSPKSGELVKALLNRAKLDRSRGDLAQSDDHLHEALSVYGTPTPETLGVAAILYSLSRNAIDRGDLEGAAELARRALAIHHRLTPGTLNEAATLTSVSWLALQLHRLDEAEETSRQSLAIRSRLGPGSLSVAESLQLLGLVALERKDFEAAEEPLSEAVEISRRQAPGSLHEASALANLGQLALRAGRWSEAQGSLSRARDIDRRLSPGSNREADVLASLGEAHLGQGDSRQAEVMFAAAVDVLEAQVGMGRLGGTDASRASYLAPYLRFHRRLIDLQLADGRPADALSTLERSRGRSLLYELARRDLAFGRDLPAGLREQLRSLDAESERLRAALPAALARGDASHEDARLAQLRLQRELLVREIARAAPRYASLVGPRVLSLAEIRASLDPGTAWLSFSVAEEKTLLFLLRPESEEVSVFTLAAGRERLAEEVALFRGLIVEGRRDAAASEALYEQAAKLYDLLLTPAEAAFATAQRLLLSPDGPLQILPFAALVTGGERRRFLIEEKPVHTVLSATLYAELRRPGARGASSDGRLVAFGDPRYLTLPGASAGPAAGSRGAPSAERQGAPSRRYERGLPAIPGSRGEVEALAALFRGRSRTYLGAQATEAAVKALPASPRYLHFACHALVDPDSPLDSALALSTPRSAAAGDDGLLEAWEIFEQLRLDADLVSLSACDTALGKDSAGEGLLGLTRAFQYAGARSVLASLWPVSDRSTAELMRRFYAALAAGAPKDRALAEAQRSLLAAADPELSHPFHWAGFELFGDGR